jgi:FAD/FMN-containing dehydrogenase
MNNMPTPSAASLLAAVLPAERIAADEPTRAAHRHDRSGWAPKGLPAAVVFPESADEVAAAELASPVSGVSA